jgi:predicted flap endonuclease-1-like 5' DNA nuclease
MTSTKESIKAMVISPARDHHLREGNGFSLPEIKKAGKTVHLVEQHGIKIDYKRTSAHDFNIEQLKTLEPIEKEGPKREPFVKKEKKKTPFKGEKVEEKEVKEAEPEGEVISLTELDGLGPKTEEKFNELGINSVNDLIKENPSELAKLVYGASEDSINDWIKEGKELLKK